MPVIENVINAKTTNHDKCTAIVTPKSEPIRSVFVEVARSTGFTPQNQAARVGACFCGDAWPLLRSLFGKLLSRIKPWFSFERFRPSNVRAPRLPATRCRSGIFSSRPIAPAPTQMQSALISSASLQSKAFGSSSFTTVETSSPAEPNFCAAASSDFLLSQFRSRSTRPG